MKKNTRQNILDAASTLFLEGGVNALSVRAIAKGANISTIGIYSHFKGKQGILDALYIAASELLEAVLISTRGNTSAEKVISACEQILHFSDTHEAHYRLLFSSDLKDFSPSEEAVRAGESVFKSLENITAALIKKEISEKEKQDIAMQCWALIHGYITLNQHEIGKRIERDNWKESALQAIRLHVYAIVATQ